MARDRIDKNQAAPIGSENTPGSASGNTQPSVGHNSASVLRGTAIVLVLAALGVTGYAIWPMWRPPPPVTIPTDIQRHPEELRSLIERHIAASNESPRDDRQRATLGLVYEANEMWPEALQSYRNATELDPEQPMWPHHAAIAWLETGDIEGATGWLRRYGAKFPTYLPLQDRLGAVLLDAGQIDEAQVIFEAIIAQVPTSAAGYVGYGDARLRAGDQAAAVEALEKAVEYGPTYRLARYLLGRAYRGVGRLEDAEREMTLGMTASRIYVSDEWSRHLGKYETGIGAMQEKSTELLEAGKAAEAAEILERVVAQKPDDAASAVNLGLAYLEMNRLDDAERVLLNAERIDSTRFEIYINLAACCLRQDRLPESLHYIDRAIELSPTAAQAHLTRGLILMKQQENELALFSLRTAADLDARNPKIFQELANACSRLGRTSEAIVHFQTLAKLLPTRWEPHFGMARALYQIGQVDEAFSATHRGLTLAPNEPRLLALARQITGANNP